MERQLSNWINSYLEYTKDSEAPLLYRKWVAVGTIAAVLQRKCHITVGFGTYYPNFYIVLVGASGARKGEALIHSRKLLEDLNIRLSANAITKEALIRALKRASETGIQERADGGIRIEMHCSLTIFSSELTVFIGYNNPAFMDCLADWWDCHDKWEYETKTQGKDEIRRIFVNLIGATTPALLNTSIPLNFICGGFVSRTIFCFAEHKGKSISLFHQRIDNDLREILKTDLEKIGQLMGEFTATEEYGRVFSEWYESSEKKPIITDVRLETYLNRRAVHLLKLSMILSASRSDSMEVTIEDYNLALSMLEEVEAKMPRVFEGFGKSSIIDTLSKVKNDLERRGEIKLDDLLRSYYYDVDKQTMENIVMMLEGMKVCSIVYTGNDTILRYKEGCKI